MQAPDAAIALTSLSKLRSYRAKVKTPDGSVAVIEWVHPDRMRIELAGSIGNQSLSNTLVFDGTTQWLAVKPTTAAPPSPVGLATAMLQRGDQKQLALTGRPFDTGFGISNAGPLSSNADFAKHVRDVLRRYQLKRVSQPKPAADCVMLEGDMPPSGHLEMLFESRRGPAAELLASGMAQNEQVLKNIVETAAHARVELCGAARLPRTLVLSPADISDSEYVVLAFEPDAPIAAERFNVPSAEQSGYVDMTARVAARNRSVEEAFNKVQEREALRRKLRELMAPKPLP